LIESHPLTSAAQMVQTRLLPCTPAAIEEAATLIAQGSCVAVPTETVYGLAADATNAQAVAGIYAVKGRPSFNPLIVHVANLAAAEQIASFNTAARDLAERHWPGPLTLVLPLRIGSGIASLATAGLSSIALRVPAHHAMQALLAATGRPLAAPSANASGSISPTRASHVFQSLDGRIPLILDAGSCEVGLESTIIAVNAEGALRLLRPGPIDLGLPLLRTTNIESPGQLASHYAPAKPLRLEAESALEGEWHIGFGRIAGDDNLSADGNILAAAARLFDALHVADASHSIAIAVAPIPENGIGAAINDRLRRAAA
jgi:L-threonylcarbamoyladenylate synthase